MGCSSFEIDSIFISEDAQVRTATAPSRAFRLDAAVALAIEQPVPPTIAISAVPSAVFVVLTDESIEISFA